MNFYQLGRDAYDRGYMCAPALNADVRDAIAGNEVGCPENIRIMREFARGYRAAADEAATALLAALLDSDAKDGNE